jgi:lysozyme
MTMKTSANGRKKIGQREGVRLKAYKDSKGIWTIGVGHIAGVHEGMKITAAECNKLLADDLRIAEAAVNHSVKVPINQDQFDSLVSLTFNIGVHAFEGSTVLKRLNARNYGGAAAAMMMWTKDVELVPRRQGEVEQFLGAGMAMHPGLMSDYQPQTEEDPSLEEQPTPIVQPVNENPVGGVQHLRGAARQAGLCQ